MTGDFAPACHVCSAPMPPAPVMYVLEQQEYKYLRHGDIFAHRGCADAYWAGDAEKIRAVRIAACQAGHHRWPGRWTQDQSDQYGDATYWECAHGCGYVHRHAGYGIGRAIAGLSL